MNNSINSLVAGTPDKSCSVDSDCNLEKTRCDPCDCGSAVNKNWNRFCPNYPIYLLFLFTVRIVWL